MTGIERLRQMAEDFKNVKTAEHCTFIVNTWRGRYINDAIADIADQIEREHNVADREEHDAATWVREHGGLESVKKMAAITLDVYQRLVDGNAGPEMLETDADTIDAMMAEIDEAIVKRGKELTRALELLDESVPRVTYERHIIKRQRQIDESHAALRRRNERIAELEHERGDLYEMVRILNAQMDEISRRLVPEGMEWLLEVWPKWSNGEYCKFGDWWKSDKYGETEPQQFRKLSVYTPEQLREWGQDDGDNYGYEWDFVRPSDPKYRPDKVEPPAPKVLDADGTEIRVGDTVWPKYPDSDPRNAVESAEVVYVHRLGRVDVQAKYATGMSFREQVNADQLTHRAPVLAADGRPLREGEHVYHVETGAELVVKEIPKPGEYQAVVVFAPPASHLTSFDPDQLTHERPDSWERLEEDVAGASCPDVYCANHHIDASDASYEWAMARDIVRRAKALAERDA